MINFVSVKHAVKKVYHLGLTVSLFFLLLYASGCGTISNSIVVSNLDDTIEAFACRASEGARRAGAKITAAELEVNAGTAFDIEAGTIIPIALPITAKGKAGIQEGTKLTIKLDLSNVKCEGAPPKVQTYKMNTETYRILEKLKIK